MVDVVAAGHNDALADGRNRFVDEASRERSAADLIYILVGGEAVEAESVGYCQRWDLDACGRPRDADDQLH